ncbi:MAG: GTP-binding protein [Clostridia bacterium]|nr:GTP-binding protein [Clostridia bacterium]
MTKVNIISGFLGAGKTTFIKRLIGEVFKGEKLVLIENEFGEIGVDGGFLQDAGIEITEMNSGCICCSLVGDFTKALEETVKTYNPDRIIIEPSGVGKLSDVIAAVNNTNDENIRVDACITVADCTKCRMYRKNFGEFYEDQINYSNCILLTRTDKATEEKIEQAVEIVRDINKDANIITTHLDLLSKEQILDAFKKGSMEEELLHEAMHAHHEHEHHHDEHCDCGCHDHEHHEHEHHHDEHCDCGCHDHEHHEHEHHHDEHCDCGCHDHEHHEHHHDENCDCGCHDHEHHHHHADEAFTSWGFETVKKYSQDEINAILTELDGGEYGIILRAKGMVEDANGSWIYFDYVPQEHDVREGSACYTGKVCVIGANLDEAKLEILFKKG